ncbi:MAG: dihydrodipicolinate synthase family protein [bacterium]|nr:dihydrodipicolinate synthase family protein [bacterium]
MGPSSAGAPSGVLRARLFEGRVIPAHPLATHVGGGLDERRQRALTRYYLAAGAGGVAAGVHTTQFAIREAGLLAPVLELVAEEVRAAAERDVLLIAGACGGTDQAVREARLASEHGYDLVLLSLAALPDATDDELIAHCRAVAEVLPLFGFYLQPAVGGRVLSRAFWRRLCELDGVAAIKVAPFDRYRTLDVVHAVSESGRADEVALYTGNDDHIVLDLLAPQRARFVGGLLGHWAVWTRAAVRLFEEVRAIVRSGAPAPPELLARAEEVTDCNAAVFDAAHGFRGCVPGIHAVLASQGLLTGTHCLDPNEVLSPGQADEIERVRRTYPHLVDDAFVAEHLDTWLR